MSVEGARGLYVMFSNGVIQHREVCNLCRRGAPCRTGARWSRNADARSITLDLAVAQACKEREDARLIAGVAWA